MKTRIWQVEKRNDTYCIDELLIENGKERVIRNIGNYKRKNLAKEICDLMNMAYKQSAEDLNSTH